MKVKKLGTLASLALAGASFCGVANAIPATWEDPIDFTPDHLVTTWSPVIYTHDITDNGFVVGADTVSSYYLTLDLYDDNDRAGEIALFSDPGNWVAGVWSDLSGWEGAKGTVFGRWLLEDTGHLTVAISSLAGDFYLGSSTLTVKGNHTVPEPATLALFGAALLGFSLVRRKRISA
jgi:hypothetical protein